MFMLICAAEQLIYTLSDNRRFILIKHPISLTIIIKLIIIIVLFQYHATAVLLYSKRSLLDKWLLSLHFLVKKNI